MTRSARSIVIAALALLLSTSSSAIEGLRASPEFVTTNALRPLPETTVPVTWNARPFASLVGTQTIGSGVGRFQIDAGGVSTVATAPGLPTQVVAGTGPNPPDLIFPEIVRIPREVVDAAVERGAQRVLFTREFTNQFTGTPAGFPGPGTIAVQQTVSIVLSTGSTGPLQVFGLELRFGAAGPLRVLDLGERVEVYADVTYAGSGEFEAVWELADEGGPSGVPLFRPLRRVERFLASGQRTTIRGPRIEAERTGPHLVRLRVETPGVSFAAPVARFAVTGTRSAIGRLRWRDGLATVRPGATLRWSSAPDAVAYRVEALAQDLAPQQRPLFVPEDPEYADRGTRDAPFFEQEPTHAQAALRVVASELVAKPMIALNRERLKAMLRDASLLRVVALDREGHVVATTTPRPTARHGEEEKPR